jgi:hypothetical protein
VGTLIVTNQSSSNYRRVLQFCSNEVNNEFKDKTFQAHDVVAPGRPGDRIRRGLFRRACHQLKFKLPIHDVCPGHSAFARKHNSSGAGVISGFDRQSGREPIARSFDCREAQGKIISLNWPRRGIQQGPLGR